MNKRILEIAKQTGFKSPSDGEFDEVELKFIEKLLTYEREQCAKICDKQLSKYQYADEWFNNGARACARAIRAEK